MYMWKDLRLHKNVTDLDPKKNLHVLRNLKPKRSVVENNTKYGFIPQDVPDLVTTSHAYLQLEQPIFAHTSTFLIKLTKPCAGIFQTRSVKCKDIGVLKVKEVIDDSNFTVELGDKVLPETLYLTHVEVYDMNSLDKDIITTVTVSALQEVDREVQEMKSSILNESRLKFVEIRMSLLENLLASISKRLDSLENL